MVEVEIENHSGWRVDEPAAAAVLRSALAAEGVDRARWGWSSWTSGASPS